MLPWLSVGGVQRGVGRLLGILGPEAVLAWCVAVGPAIIQVPRLTSQWLSPREPQRIARWKCFSCCGGGP